jgi:small subunit ribosomal protein S1
MTERVDATMNKDAADASHEGPREADEAKSIEVSKVATEESDAAVTEEETTGETLSDIDAEVPVVAEETVAESSELSAVNDNAVELAAEVEETEVTDEAAETDVAPVDAEVLADAPLDEPHESEVKQADAENVSADDLSAEGGSSEMASDDSTDPAEEESGEGVDEDEPKREVRMLAVGQQVDGVVRRITDFGAFIDIGVGRDGLIHISELSTQRVAKVSDALSENQEIQPWIKKLDRKRNRISLTLIDPEMKTIRDLKAGDIAQGTVTRILPYGAFVDIGIGRDALLHVREMSSGFVEKPEDVVQVGENIEVRIIELSRRRGRVDLSLKGLRDEPEPEPVVEDVAPEEEPVAEADEFEDVEVLSPMELAFKKAVEAEGAEIRVNKKKRGKRDRGRDNRSLQDEIIARTLDTARK